MSALSESGTFIANGITYHIEKQISIARYIKYEELELEMGFGKTFGEVFDICQAAMTDINGHKQGEAYVKLYNLVYGIKNFDNKHPFVLRYCALIINAEGEDRGVINDDMINVKIENWTKEGLDIADFFQYVVTSLPAFRDRYKKLMETYSTNQSDQSKK